MPEQAVEWDDANVATLKRMWSAGDSASVIAAAIPFCTRSAVLGKVSRLKLAPRREHNARAATQSVQKFVAGPNETTQVRKITSRPTMTAEPAKRPRHNITRLQAIANDHDPGRQLEEPSDGKGVSLFELTNWTCRWPKGDPLQPGFLFCGDTSANLQEDRPYCPFHKRKSIDLTRIRSPRAFEESAMYAARQR